MTASPASVTPESEEPRIGPNAITRLGEALAADPAAGDAAPVFRRAGLAAALESPPADMVPQGDVIALYSALDSALGSETAARIAADAGRRTGAYLLAHRIPKPVQAVLRPLPSALAGPVLLRAIQRNAWTFAGSGEVAIAGRGAQFRVTFTNAPTCAVSAIRAFYAGTFERLFRELVRGDLVARPVAALDGEAWHFDITPRDSRTAA